MPITFSDLRTIDMLASWEADELFTELAGDLPGLCRGLDLLIQSLEGPEADTQGVIYLPFRDENGDTDHNQVAYEMLVTCRDMLRKACK